MAKSQKPEQKPLARSTPPATAMTPFEEMDRLFDDFFGRRWPRAWMRPFRWETPTWGEMTNTLGLLPRVDLLDGEAEIVVKAELPGVKKEDLELSIEEETVIIRGRTSHEERSESANYLRAEISRGEFVRTIALPAAVDASKANAKLENGVLELTLPKVEKAKRHAIKIE